MVTPNKIGIIFRCIFLTKHFQNFLLGRQKVPHHRLFFSIFGEVQVPPTGLDDELHCVWIQ